MDSILTDVMTAIDDWLDNLRVTEEQYEQVRNTQDRIQQTLLQMQYEGGLSTEIQFIANLWTDILDSLSTDNKEQLLVKILALFECGGISRDLTYHFIVHLF